jgi:hypothetical protein
MQPLRTVFRLSLIPALIALPFWGVFGFVMIGMIAAMIGCAWLVIGPIFRD